MVSVKTIVRPVVDVTITSDLVCPWYFVGLRKLQEAVGQANVDVKVTLKPYMLRPNAPEDGTPNGGTPASRVGVNLKRAGESVGIDFTGVSPPRSTPSNTDYPIQSLFLTGLSDDLPVTLLRYYTADGSYSHDRTLSRRHEDDLGGEWRRATNIISRSNL
jgi:hypothetical protein